MEKNALRAFAYIVLAGAAIVRSPAARNAAAGEVRAAVVAARAETRPVVDGKLDDACWRNARPITAFRTYPGGDPSALRTEGRVCYDDAGLYVGMTCSLAKGAKPVGTMKPHDSYVFRDDLVEIMVDPGRSQSTYYQFCINAFGAKFDTARSGGGARQDSAWDGQWVAKATQEPGSYSVEVAIPFHSLGVTPKVGTEWGLNLTRTSAAPWELSSIADGGAFNEASKFVVLQGIDADLKKYCFLMGPMHPVLDRGAKGCAAELHTPVKNLTGTTRALRVAIHRRGPGDEPSVEARNLTLKSGEQADLTLEKVRMTPLFSRRTDLYVRPSLSTKSVVLHDAATGEVYAHFSVVPSTLGDKLRVCWEPIRIEAPDPWQPGEPSTKTEAISLTVHCALVDAGARLEVSLASRDRREVVATRTIQRPKAANRVTFGSRQLPWGAYEVKAALWSKSGEEMFSTKASATVLPGGKHRIEGMNMLVADLMDVRKRGLGSPKEVSFMNPRHGWCFFRFAGECVAKLDRDGRPLGTARRGGEAVEAMRLLPAGRHTVRIDGSARDLVVRAIPALVYNVHPTSPHIRAFGPHTWARLRASILPQCNTIEAGPSVDPAEVAEWCAAGRLWVANQSRPGIRGPQEKVEEAYGLWRSSPGYAHPLFGGIQIDEFGPGTYSEEGYMALARNAALLAEDPKFKGRLLIPFACRVYGSSGGLVFMKSILAAGWPFSEEWYISERPTEEEARKAIHHRLVESARGWEAVLPGSVRRMIVTLMYSSLPYCATNTCPMVDFKVHLDMQFRTLATDPTFFGLYGVQPYRSNYVDPDTLFWTGRLMRHYCIEGRTERLSPDPYELRHVLNPDFDDAAAHWQTRPGEPGSMKAAAYPGYGTLQGRYHRPGSQGDRFLMTRRSDKAPNEFSQEVKGLQPGRVYSLRMYTGDYGHLQDGTSRRLPHVVAIRLDRVDLLPGQEHAFQYPFPSFRSVGKFTRQRPFWMNFHWRVFRAKEQTADLTVTDWQAKGKPGGPIGQQLMFNFIEVQPCLQE